jgi:DNA-binding transcriptional regulator LsrR (DeoR family)
VAECVQLEQQLCEQFSLDYCEVVPDFDHDELPLRALGLAGGQYLHRLLDGATVKTVGLGHGRTMAACVENIPRTRGTHVEFVSLLGGFSRKFAANPHDVIHRLAERTGAPSYVLPVPFLADSIKDRDILMGQRGLQKVMELARTSPLKVAGVGDLNLTSTLVATEMVSKTDIEKVIKAGGAGELLGNFFADDGTPVNTSLSRRTIGLSVDDIKSSQVIAIAGGSAKSKAIRAVLHSKLLSGLITDERTAQTLV